jgi:hypothetical protein
LTEIGGLKATFTSIALVFTSVYIMWMDQELYYCFGKKKGYSEWVTFMKDVRKYLSFESMFNLYQDVQLIKRNLKI